MSEIEHLDFQFHTLGEKAVELVVRPVKDFLPTIKATQDKAVAELTPMEVLAWVAVAAYAFMLGTVLTQVVSNVAGVVLRGPARR